MRYHFSKTRLQTLAQLVVAMLVSTIALNFLPGCAQAQDPAATVLPAGMPATQIEPNAGKWKTWVLSSGSQLRLYAPPGHKATKAEIRELKMMESQRDAGALDLINFWDAGSPSYRWNEIANSEIVKNNVNTPRRARALALINVAIYDALIAAWDSKYVHNRARPSDFDPSLSTVLTSPQSPSYPSEHAVAAGAASAVLAYLFPSDAKFFTDQAEAAGRSRLLAGVQFPSDVSDGLTLGRAVADLVIARARTDGSDARFTGTIPTGPCRWKGTNPAEPMTGTWSTWVLSSGSQFRPGPPPPCDSAQMASELAEVKSFVRTLPAVGSNFNTTRLGLYWQGVPSFWTDLASQKIFEYRLDRNAPRAARVYALINIAFYDTTVACWDAKYAYWAIRPDQLDPTVTTLFATPTHPSYPSAHATIGGPYAAMLGYLFPRDTDLFNSFAIEGANSRIWAGIHFRSDIDAGLALSHAVAQAVMDRANSDGSQ